MTTKTVWQQLKDLVECDQKIVTIQQEIAHAKNGLERDLSAENKCERALQEKKQLVFDLQKSINLKELSSKELKEKEEHRRSQLETVKGQKEYMALESEIAHLAKERAAIEEEILKQWSTIDSLKKELEDLAGDTIKQEEILRHDMQIKQDNISHLQTKLAETEQQRATAFNCVQPEWQTQYQRMQNSVPDPIVPVIHASCSACYYAISFPEMSKLKKGDIAPCRSCYRFLYYNADEEKNAVKAQY